jgi:ParB family chromosome partitioning protein
MATQKKGQGISFRIPGQDAGEAEPASPTPARDAARYQPKTGIGLLSRVISDAQGDSEEVARLQDQVTKLKLQVGEQLLDPRLIKPSRWADRHPDSFASLAFMELRDEIAAAGGNVQPVKVRPISGASPSSGEPCYELVFGSRRTRACRDLGLRVRAVIDDGLSDQDLYVQMQRENRGRANLSAWEQGVSYRRALDEGLFPSARRLAEVIGVDQSNLSKALRVASLPEEVVGAFSSPCDIQFRWVAALDKAMAGDPDSVLDAARALRSRSSRPMAMDVFKALTRSSKDVTNAKTKPSLAKLPVFTMHSDASGVTTVKIPRGSLDPSKLAQFEKGLAALVEEFGLGR